MKTQEGGKETMGGIQEADGRVIPQRKAPPLGEGESGVDSLLLLLGTHRGPSKRGAQLMLMATTAQVSGSYLSLTSQPAALCFPSPRGEEAGPEGRRQSGALRGAGTGEGAAGPGKGAPARRTDGGAGPGEATP